MMRPRALGAEFPPRHRGFRSFKELEEVTREYPPYFSPRGGRRLMTEALKKFPVRVVVIDDHEMILQSVVRLLTADVKIEVVGTGLTAAEGIEVMSELRPDVVVIDYHLPDMDAPEAIKLMYEIDSDVKIVTISGSDRPGSFYESMKAGSQAWVRKTRAIQELRLAIFQVASGEPYVSEEMEVQPKLDQLMVHYQPIVSLEDWQIVGFEALVRWQHPERGLLFPDDFLPNLIDSGFIGELDLWVLRESLRQLGAWQSEFSAGSRLFVTVNISRSSLKNPRTRSLIVREIENDVVASRDVILEVKESILVESPEETIGFLRQLNDAGIRLALDDFGASFSNISHIQQVPFDCIKIGRSFTRELPMSAGTLWLMEGIRTVTNAMNTLCVVEGIENMEQFQTLRGAGLKYGQGFLFSPALRPAGCAALLAQDSLEPTSTFRSAANVARRAN
jgi:EAL domain-containing protein (putative c-di-GMP-specific phosphodiesterase class I)